MGIKLNWTGLFIIVASSAIIPVPAAAVVGAVIFLIGLVLTWLDK